MGPYRGILGVGKKIHQIDFQFFCKKVNSVFILEKVNVRQKINAWFF